MAEELKLDRHDVTEGGGTFKCPGGELVYYSDVEELIAERSDLRARLAKYEDAEGRPAVDESWRLIKNKELRNVERLRSLSNHLLQCAHCAVKPDISIDGSGKILMFHDCLAFENRRIVKVSGDDKHIINTWENLTFPPEEEKTYNIAAIDDGCNEIATLFDLIEQAQSAPEPVSRETVRVVGVRISTDGFGSYIADSAMGIGGPAPGEVRESLMTVAQHHRIMAARSPIRSDEDDTPLYTHPADQVAEGVVVSRPKCVRKPT